MSVATGMHIEQGHGIDQQLKLVLQRIRRAAKRGIGPPQRAGCFRVEILAEIAWDASTVARGAPADMRDAVLICCWWLLREIEGSSLKMSNVGKVRSGEFGKEVELRLGVTKTHIQGIGKRRRLRCICNEGDKWSKLCPVEAVERQRVRRGSVDENDFFFVDAMGQPTSKSGWIAALRVGLECEDGSLSGHSMRRSGAKFLAHRGLPEWLIQFMGRWGSGAVRLYIEEAYAEMSSGVSAAAARGPLGLLPAAEVGLNIESLKIELLRELSQRQEIRSDAPQVMPVQVDEPELMWKELEMRQENEDEDEFSEWGFEDDAREQRDLNWSAGSDEESVPQLQTDKQIDLSQITLRDCFGEDSELEGED